jgi:hypothetical protein
MKAFHFASEMRRVKDLNRHTAADAAATFDGLNVRTFNGWIGDDPARWPREYARRPLVEFYERHARPNAEPPAGRPMKQRRARR